MQASMFRRAWSFTRGLTLDLLDALDEEAFLYSPDPRMGPFWKQFRHVGRVQENYLQGIESGRMRFDVTDTYRGGPSGDALADYLQSVDDRLWERLATTAEGGEIDWNGEKVLAEEHLNRLVAHETLHHGQWIVYIHLLGRSFPTSWAAWGL